MKLDVWQVWLLFALIILGRPWSYAELVFLGIVLGAYWTWREWRK